MTVDEITAADLWHTAYRQHLRAIQVRLCPRIAFEKCDSRACVLARDVLGPQVAAR